jgi:hypothetical protein
MLRVCAGGRVVPPLGKGLDGANVIGGAPVDAGSGDGISGAVELTGIRAPQQLEPPIAGVPYEAAGA